MAHRARAADLANSLTAYRGWRGKDREVQTLLADPARKLVLIRLRNGALLGDHSARFPITIQGVAGKGTLRWQRCLWAAPGTVVPVEAQAVYSVQGEPAIAILVSFFRQAGAQDGNDTTASFDSN